MSEIEYTPCERQEPHGIHTIEAGVMCPGKDTGPIPVIGADVTIHGETGEVLASSQTDEEGKIDLDHRVVEASATLTVAAGATEEIRTEPVNWGPRAYLKGADARRDITEVEIPDGLPEGSPYQPDPNRPHAICGQRHAHDAHNWNSGYGEQFCNGSALGVYIKTFVSDVIPKDKFLLISDFSGLQEVAMQAVIDGRSIDTALREALRKRAVLVDASESHEESPEAAPVGEAPAPTFWAQSVDDEAGEETTPDADRLLRSGYPGPIPEFDKVEENRSLPVRWADRAMYEAEPIDAEAGPQVHLMWMSPDPLGAIAAACLMYEGRVVRDLREISDEERLKYLEQVNRTKLKAPFEFVKVHLLFEGVSRSFTHQQVRQRTAVYAQESLRFAVKEDMPMYIPPAIRENPEALAVWQDHNEMTKQAYEMLIDMGIPAEDARGRLPHDILTRVHYSTDFRALLDHAGNRLCTQAQFEWRRVFAALLDTLRKVSTDNILKANGIESVYMADRLVDSMRPVCYQTGRCEFKASFDRHCSIRERVDANAAVGRPSSEWHEDTPHGAIKAIKPGEWLLDHKSARRQ